MKKLILFFLLIMLLPYVQGQSLSADMATQQQKAGDYLIKSSQDLYASTGFAIVSTVCFIAASSINENPDESSPKNFIYGIGGVAALGSISFYIAHIIHLNKAGNQLKYNSPVKPGKITMKTGYNSFGLAYNF